jgi:hypothetical protein
MKNQLIKRACILAGMLLVGCGGSFQAEKGLVDRMQRVAVIAFTVPGYVIEEAKSSGDLAGLSAAVGFAAQVAGGKQIKGNGEQVAQEAYPGFIKTMLVQMHFKLVDHQTVVNSTEFQAVKAQYDESSTYGLQKAAMTGLPVVGLAKGDKAELARKAAKALGVDGVLMIDVDELKYSLYTGIQGSGTAKANGKAYFKLYEASGKVVWQDLDALQTDKTAAMVTGGLVPDQAKELHEDVGVTIASKFFGTYQKKAGK